MARTVTRETIRNDARALADAVENEHSNDDQLNLWINQELAAPWDILVTSYPDWYYQTAQITTTVGTSSYALPDDFYQVRLVDLVQGNDRLTVEPYQLQEKNQYRNSGAAWLITWQAGRAPVRYRIMGKGIDGTQTRIYFEPEPRNDVYEIHYVQAPQTLDADSDEYDGQAGWEDYISYGVAKRILLREESLEAASMMGQDQERIKRRIQLMAARRDVGRAPRIADTRANQYWYPRSR